MTDRHGILLVDKPEGPTSHDIVALVRRLLGERRIGHAGTLDPLATGLLVLMIGRATRLATFLSGVDKIYRGTLKLGVATETYDRDGDPVGPPREVRVDRERLIQALDKFRGTIRQVPPAFSAKKVHGTPMYRLARRKRPVSPIPVCVTFSRIDLLGMQGDIVEVETEVSAGTYLRSFAHDLGQVLGCGGHLRSLRRLACGPFHVDDALTPAALEEMGNGAAARIVPMEEIPLGLPTLSLTASGAHAIFHGRPCPISEVTAPRPPVPPGRCRLLNREGRLLGVGEVVLAAPAEGRPVVRPQIVFPA